MQYRIAAQIDANDLTSVLEALHQYTENIGVRPVEKGQASERPARQPAPKVTRTEATNGPTKPLRRSSASYKRKYGKFATDMAVEAISEKGTLPFKTGDIVKVMKKRGASHHVVFRAINQLVLENKLKKLGRGIYQRTPESITGTTGLAARTLAGLRVNQAQ